MAAAAKRWTAFEINLLKVRREQKVAPKIIAEELGRSVSSVTMRCQIDNVRKCQRRLRVIDSEPRQQVEVQWVVPPQYVRRERDIRLSIPAQSVTQLIFSDPVEGYSALANKSRKISVQDALEICALYTGKASDIQSLAQAYGISHMTIRQIIDGSFFERLLPRDRVTA